MCNDRLIPALLSLAVILCLASPTLSYDTNRRLHEIFKGIPSIEKVEMKSGSEAVWKGEKYDQVFIFTVNDLYLSQQNDSLSSYVKGIREKILSIVKVGKALAVFSTKSGKVYDTFPIPR